MSGLRFRLIRGKVQMGSWVMRPPIERARTYLILAPSAHPDPDPTADRGDAA